MAKHAVVFSPVRSMTFDLICRLSLSNLWILQVYRGFSEYFSQNLTSCKQKTEGLRRTLTYKIPTRHVLLLKPHTSHTHTAWLTEEWVVRRNTARRFPQNSTALKQVKRKGILPPRAWLFFLPPRVPSSAIGIALAPTTTPHVHLQAPASACPGIRRLGNWNIPPAHLPQFLLAVSPRPPSGGTSRARTRIPQWPPPSPSCSCSCSTSSWPLAPAPPTPWCPGSPSAPAPTRARPRYATE